MRISLPPRVCTAPRSIFHSLSRQRRRFFAKSTVRNAFSAGAKKLASKTNVLHAARRNKNATLVLRSLQSSQGLNESRLICPCNRAYFQLSASQILFAVRTAYELPRSLYQSAVGDWRNRSAVLPHHLCCPCDGWPRGVAHKPSCCTSSIERTTAYRAPAGSACRRNSSWSGLCRVPGRFTSKKYARPT